MDTLTSKICPQSNGIYIGTYSVCLSPGEQKETSRSIAYNYMHACMHACMHARTHTHTHMYIPLVHVVLVSTVWPGHVPLLNDYITYCSVVVLYCTH